MIFCFLDCVDAEEVEAKWGVTWEAGGSEQLATAGGRLYLNGITGKSPPPFVLITKTNQRNKKLLATSRACDTEIITARNLTYTEL